MHVMNGNINIIWQTRKLRMVLFVLSAFVSNVMDRIIEFAAQSAGRTGTYLHVARVAGTQKWNVQVRNTNFDRCCVDSKTARMPSKICGMLVDVARVVEQVRSDCSADR